MASRTLCWLLLFILVTALALRTHTLIRGEDTDTICREQATYEYLRNIIRERYVKDVDDKKLFYGAMQGMTSSLDPHSHFFPPEDYEQFEVHTSGQMEGVGMELDSRSTKGIAVLTPLQGTPAWNGGVLPGDRILKINGQTTEKMKSEDARSLIKGLVGTQVTLTLLHEGDTAPVDVTLVRAAFDLKSVPVVELLGKEWVPAQQPKIGYIEVTGFQQKTAEDIEAALNKLEAQGMEGLILDLRQNPGGLLHCAEAVCDMFLRDGPIVSVIGRVGEDGKSITQTTYAHEAGTHPDYPIVVMLDSQSASASEIVSGCLKDRGRAVLVGDRSYGKFSVQEVLPLSLGKLGKAALKLTTAHYKTPIGDCIDEQGIVPDYLVPSTPEQQRALNLDRLQRHLKDNNPRQDRPAASAKEVYDAEADDDPKTTPKTESTPKKPAEPFVDLQLKKAVEVMGQRIKK